MAKLGAIKFTTYERSTSIIKTRLTTIQNSVSTLAEMETPLTQVQIRSLANYLVEIQKKRGEFENNLARVIEHVNAEEAPESRLAEDENAINDLFVNISSVIESLLPTESTSTPSSTQSDSTPHFSQSSQVKLPKLELRNFDGNPSQWISFKNLFDTAVHKNTAISNVAKMQYLISTLTGEPLSLVQSLNITSANYVIAYELLCERYHNPRRLTTLHLNQILDLPNISAHSTKPLRTFVNLFFEHTQALKALECDISSDPNPLLSALILRKMDNDLRKKLEIYRSRQNETQHSLPHVKSIVKFLNEECAHTEDANLHQSHPVSKTNFGHSSTLKGGNKQDKPSEPKLSSFDRKVSMMTTHSSATNASSSHPCFACQQTGHKIYTCSVFKIKSPQERFKIVKDQHRCVSCLGAHTVKQCSSKSNCFKCHKKHHTLLHFDTNENNNFFIPPRSQPQDKTVVAASAQPLSHVHSSSHSTVLLGTTLVKLTASNGKTHVFRALLDCGSMCDFLSERASQLLGATRHKSTQTIIGISQTPSHTKGCVTLDLASLNGHYIASQHLFHILDRISVNLPRTQLAPEVFQKMKPYTLADPTFHLPGAIDVLLGCALFPRIMTQETHSLGPNMPYVIGTHFGYVVMGSAPCAIDSSSATHFTSFVTTTDYDLHSSLQKFWQQEEPPQCVNKCAEEQFCDDHFASTYSRDSNGRYIVKLPFKPDPTPLGNSHFMAERRLYSLERKFQSQPRFHDLYVKFMEEYKSLGHMEKLDNFDVETPHYFLPHHGILKENSSTTKLRAVFDASSKTSSGISLNDNLLTGRKLQTNICDLILHFRTHQVVFSCDIRQMYRQIKVHPHDQLYQLILWRDAPSQEISIYKLTTVTYGMNSSPYLAIRTLYQLAEDEGEDFPKAAHVLKTQTYVDDVITGADTIEDAKDLQDQLIGLLKRGGFELRKWLSNSSHLLQMLPKEHLESPVFLQKSQQPHFTILGLHWSPNSDCFLYNINLPLVTPTKRSVLSIIARIYDPCGFLAPYIMLAKCFMQVLWASGLNWDEPLPQDLALKWQTFVQDSVALGKIEIPRAIKSSQTCILELHGFSDASESGYAAVVYIRCQSPDSEEVTVRQILAKTRVAPLKRVTMPRLELCGAHLLAQLVTYCFSIFKNKFSFVNTYLWCDSSVVLSWLQTPSFRLKTYVANRVAQTQELIPNSCWHYVPSKDNPADCASRGLLASHLQDHYLWWHGPKWLCLPSDRWPFSQTVPNEDQVSAEIKTTPLSVLVTTPSREWDLMTKFSSWTKLQFVMAYILRFIFNCRQHKKLIGPISTQELESAQHHIFKCVQSVVFTDDINRLTNGQHCSTRLHRLTPFLDKFGILRVGGRLNKAPLTPDVRHPVVLPKKNHVTNLIVDYYHKKNLHSGPQLTQSLICQNFWILSARSVIRSRIFNCVTCFKVKPRNNAPLMGDLPTSRVTPARPFLSTGIDYCGPFNIKVINLRAIRHTKVYICVFICLVTKAVHLEVVSDMTTDAFIATLTRFVSRRGLCLDIYSDCGTNFVGADISIRKIINTNLHSTKARQEIHHFTASQKINFHFNPPAAPHQGGLWESAVKSAKYHLRRVMGETVLTLIDFITLVTQIEAMLNSRPLTHLSSDPSDLSALSPGHFLIGEPLTSIPQLDLSNVPTNRLKQWQLVQALYQRIWQRWQLEYIHTLQQRSKWTQTTTNLKVGDLVLIHTSSAPLTWPLAKVVAVHPGSDGMVRVVDLKTSTGYLTRPAVKVFPLPIE